MTETLVPPLSPRWNPRSVALIVLAWLILHIGCLFTPGLLDDVDSVYIEIAREMLLRHNYVTPYIDGIRFFDKPPLMYWLAAGSMRLFGPSAWAARLPLALLTLALFLATYALGLRLFAQVSPRHAPDRGALYSALALATCIGPYLYTRFFIPDILICLWMTLAVHAFLVALERLTSNQAGAPHLASEMWEKSAQSSSAPSTRQLYRDVSGVTPRPPTTNSALLPCLACAAVTGLNLLTKGFIGLVFPLGFVFLYLLLTRQLRLLPKFHLFASTVVFLAIAAPWHVLAALRNPAIGLPEGLGLPARGGWAWFYLYNEHIARFLSKRIPHDYGQVPIPLFWLLAAIWLFPWIAFLPSAIARHIRELRIRTRSAAETRQPSLTLLLWAGVVLVFFTLSARQEYYSLPALPALALMAGGLLASADREDLEHVSAAGSALVPSIAWHKWMLVPLGSLCALGALYFAITAPTPKSGTDISALLAQGGDYNLSLSHLFDLTGAAMGLFRGPLILFGCSMAAIGPLSYVLRRRHHTFSANFALAAASTCLLLAVHAGLVRFYPTLGSEPLADAILTDQVSRHAPTCTVDNPSCPDTADLILVDGELTSGSTLLFYTRQTLHLVNGRVNGPWYGSFWPDSPHIFETDDSLRQLWSSPRRIYLLTYHPDQRVPDLARFGAVHVLASSGGKSILTN